jgi:16S rRNA (guanine1516-N2)-methyltransferase
LLDFSASPRELPSGQALLMVSDGVPTLQMTGRGAPGPVTVDFGDGAMVNRRRAGHNELLGKAVGWKQASAPRVLDATAGFCRDAFLLADLGCEVRACERNPVMAVLIQSALERAIESDDDWLRSVCARIEVFAQDARDLGAPALAGVDVIYLDPMFPLDRRAAPGKEMQLLHRLLGHSDTGPAAGDMMQDAVGAACAQDDAALLAWARSQPVRRVVVKRPRRAPPVSGASPGHSLTGRSVRFDVYPLAAPVAPSTF